MHLASHTTRRIKHMLNVIQLFKTQSFLEALKFETISSWSWAGFPPHNIHADTGWALSYGSFRPDMFSHKFHAIMSWKPALNPLLWSDHVLPEIVFLYTGHTTWKLYDQKMMIINYFCHDQEYLPGIEFSDLREQLMFKQWTLRKNFVMGAEISALKYRMSINHHS
jgi:hypothetical protein